MYPSLAMVDAWQRILRQVKKYQYNVEVAFGTDLLFDPAWLVRNEARSWVGSTDSAQESSCTEDRCLDAWE